MIKLDWYGNESISGLDTVCLSKDSKEEDDWELIFSSDELGRVASIIEVAEHIIEDAMFEARDNIGWVTLEIDGPYTLSWAPQAGDEVFSISRVSASRLRGRGVSSKKIERRLSTYGEWLDGNTTV